MRLIRQARRALKIGRNNAVRLVKAWQWQPAVPLLRRKQQLLIVREEALGDVLLATPIVREIRRQHPDAYITFLTNWKSEELLAGNPDIDEVVVNKTHLAGRRFDKTFELWYEYEPDLHIVDAYARRLGIELTNRDYVLPLERRHLAFAERVFDQHEIRPQDLVIGVHTHATWQNRNWEPNHFCTVLDHFQTQYGARVIEFGTDPLAYLNAGVNLIRRCSIKETAASVARCSLLLCVDSALLHIAGAVHTPVVGIFGPVLPHTRLPFNAISMGCILSDLPCIGCHHRSPVPAIRTDCTQPRIYCMQDLQPGVVIEAMEALLEQTRQSGVLQCGMKQ